MEGMPLLRLLWLTENYPPTRGGMAESCDRIVYGLRRAGVTVDVVHFSPRWPRLTVELKQGGRHLACPVGAEPAHDLNCLWNRLAAEADRLPFTHVVAFGGTLPLLAGPVLAAWLDAPLITLLRGNDFDIAVFTSRRNEILREALIRSARVCVVSQDKARKITALYPQIEPVWIPNGLDLARWEALPSHMRQAAGWRAQHVAPARRVLGLFGQIKPKKGARFFLEELLASGYADRYHLLLVGEVGDDERSWLAAHEQEIVATLVPFVDRYDLLAYYPACDLVVIPSFYDGLPNVLLEAAALSRPLLATRVGGMADVLVDGEHGFVFTPGDPFDCRRAIAQAATAPPEALCRQGQAARALIEERLSSAQEVGRYLAVLRETVRP